MDGNGFVAWLLRSRWHGLLSKNTILLTVRGRRSGKAITLPVNYVRHDDELWVISNRTRRWWRNLVGGAQVLVLLQGCEIEARAETVTDEDQIVAMLPVYLAGLPMAAKALNVEADGDAWRPADLAAAAKARVMVRVKL